MSPEEQFQEALKRQQEGRHEEAIALYNRALAREPNRPSAWLNLGVALRAVGRLQASLACQLRARELQPRSAAVLGNLGNVLKDLGRFDEALAAHRRAVALEPRNPRALHNLATTLKEAGDLLGSLAALEQACALDDELPAVQFDRGLALLQLGRYPEGWPFYEARLELPEFANEPPRAPRWRGERFAGKRLRVHTEQGFGDSVLASRFLPGVKALGGEVWLECRPELRRLFEGIDGVDRIVAPGETTAAVDLDCPIMSLPGALGTTLDSIPHPTRFRISTERRGHYRRLFARYGDRLKVGVVWSGSLTFKGNRWRAVPLERFLTLAEVPGTQLFSLQKGALQEQIRASGAGSLLIDLGTSLGDFADTAAVIEELDLVIMTDSAVAHIAGSLGKPVWNLLSSAPYWLYGTEGDRTPWYPSMRLWRPDRYGDWTGVFARARAALTEAARARREGRWPTEVASGRRRDRRPRAATLRSAFRRPDGTPRFELRFEASAVADPGVRALVTGEARGGYEYPTRLFFDEHCEADDLFIDVGAHWGVYSLHASTRWPSVRVLAIEPDPRNLTQLRNAVERNGLSDRVEIVAAAAGASGGTAALLPDSSMGHSLHLQAGSPPGRMPLSVPVLSIDALLEERPELGSRRTLIKVDVEGLEPEALQGAHRLLQSGRVAAVVWEHGRAFAGGERRERMLEAVEVLREMGFALFRVPHHELGGPLVPFAPTPESFNVFALARGFEPRAVYARPERAPEPLPAPSRAPADPEVRRRTAEMLREWKATDAARWADFEAMRAGATERARLAAAHVPAGASVLDLGAGTMALRDALPEGCAYQPADLVPWDDSTLVVDLNQGQFPEGAYGCAVVLDVLEFLHDPAALVRRAARATGHLIVSYRVADAARVSARRERGYFNDLTMAEFENLLRSSGWNPEPAARVDDLALFDCTESLER